MKLDEPFSTRMELVSILYMGTELPHLNRWTTCPRSQPVKSSSSGLWVCLLVSCPRVGVRGPRPGLMQAASPRGIGRRLYFSYGVRASAYTLHYESAHEQGPAVMRGFALQQGRRSSAASGFCDSSVVILPYSVWTLQCSNGETFLCGGAAR